jgi:hypothetical protein
MHAKRDPTCRPPQRMNCNVDVHCTPSALRLPTHMSPCTRPAERWQAARAAAAAELPYARRKGDGGRVVVNDGVLPIPLCGCGAGGRARQWHDRSERAKPHLPRPVLPLPQPAQRVRVVEVRRWRDHRERSLAFARGVRVPRQCGDRGVDLRHRRERAALHRGEQALRGADPHCTSTQRSGVLSEPLQ